MIVSGNNFLLLIAPDSFKLDFFAKPVVQFQPKIRATKLQKSDFS